MSTIVADYPIECGTSGIWTYEKMHSGVVKCWGSSTHSGMSSQKWTDGHFYFAVEPIDFREGLFISKPTVLVTVEEDGANFFSAKRTSTSTNTGALYAISLASFDTNKSVTFNIEAIGRWK